MSLRAVVAVALVAVSSWTSPAIGGSPKCPPAGGAAAVRLDVLDGGVAYDFSRTSDQIAALGGHAAHVGSTRGLTSTTFRSGLSVAFERLAVPGGFCLRPVEISAEVGFDPMVVYVERKYPRGSCEFRIVLDHEHRHVRINRETLAARMPRIRAALEAVAASPDFPVFGRDYESAKAMAMGKIGAAFQREISALSRERDALNARLDSPESYRASQAACTGW